MKVYELIEKLKRMPLVSEVKIDNGEYLENVGKIEYDERDYVIIRKT
jgi:hypothetical protein